MKLRRVVLGLGTNLGDRAQNLGNAVEALSRLRGVRVLAQSSLYETPPAGGPPQPHYWNGALLVETTRLPGELLSEMLTIEQSLGRIRPDPIRWGPRTIDLDILWIESEIIDEENLKVPHPRLFERVFALRPLLDVAPDALDPFTGQRYDAFPAASLPIARIGST